MAISKTNRTNLFCSGKTSIERLRGGRITRDGMFVLIFDLVGKTNEKIRAVIDINAIVRLERVIFKSSDYIDYGTNDGHVTYQYKKTPLYLKNILRREWFDRYDRVAKMAKYQCL